MRYLVPLFFLLALLSGVAQAAPDGAKLFSQHCAACHGDHGQGGVGIPLALPDFLTTVSDQFLFTTIREGRPGRVMPAFKEFSDAQIKAVIGYIRGWMPTGSKVAAEDSTPVSGDAKHGKQLFAQRCAVCHGDNGQGGHGTGVTFSRPRDLPIIPPGLNNPGFLAAASDQMIKATLMHGRKGTPMVSFLEQGLSEQDINDVVAYVRSFTDHPMHWTPPQDQEPVITYESPYSVEETVEAVKRAAIGRNFRIIRVQTLENGLVPEDQEDPNQVIVYFCNFGFINKALTLDPRVGLFMPCRVTVLKRGDKVLVMAMNPKYMNKLYNNQELDQACNHMHDTYIAILEEATL